MTWNRLGNWVFFISNLTGCVIMLAHVSVLFLPAFRTSENVFRTLRSKNIQNRPDQTRITETETTNRGGAGQPRHPTNPDGWMEMVSVLHCSCSADWLPVVLQCSFTDTCSLTCFWTCQFHTSCSVAAEFFFSLLCNWFEYFIARPHPWT